MAWISCLHSRLYKNANGRSFEYVWPVIQRRRAFARPRSASRGHIRVRVLCMRVVLWTVLKEKKKKKKKHVREKATRERIDAEKVCRVQRCKPSYPLLRCELVLAHLLALLLLLLRPVVFVLYFHSFRSIFSRWLAFKLEQT